MGGPHIVLQNSSAQNHFLGDDEEKLCRSSGIPQIPGITPVGLNCRTQQQCMMISLHRRIRIAGGMRASGWATWRVFPLSNSPPVVERAGYEPD